MSDIFPIFKPDTEVSAKKLFGVDFDAKIPAFSKPGEHTPPVDTAYRFDPETTRALLAGFVYNRRVMVQGYHGTGKSTHIEQVAARLNWPSIRINLDSHISRIDLIGKDAIVLKDGKQRTEFREGLLPWALQNPVALVFDEFVSLGELKEADIIKLMAEHQDEEFNRLGLEFQSLWGRPLQLIDVQNLFCEVDKYSRVAHPNISGISGRKKIKQKFRMNPSPIEYWYPPKWGLNEQLSKL